MYLVDTYGAMNGASALAANGLLRYVAGFAFPLFTFQSTSSCLSYDLQSAFQFILSINIDDHKQVLTILCSVSRSWHWLGYLPVGLRDCCADANSMGFVQVWSHDSREKHIRYYQSVIIYCLQILP